MKLRILAAALLCVALNHAPALGQTTLLPLGLQCFAATTGLNGMVGALGTITGGSGGTAGTYGGVALTGGSGTGATANITVSGGAVTAVTILNPGTQFVVGDVLNAAAGTIGGVTGFSVPVNSVTINSSLAGGTVGYYIPNTLTFKTTWKNSTQTIPNTNPVRLDQNGCGTVYGLGSYRQIVKDSLGNTVWDALTASTAALGTNPATSGAGDFLAIGTVLPIAGFTAPTNYVLAFGQTLSRTSFPDALTALTISSSASCVSSSTTISGLSSTAQMRVGAPIEGSCIAPGTTISSISSSSAIVISIAATSTSPSTIQVFNWGNGDGSTTFNIPDLRGRVLPGPDAMGGSAASRLTSTYYGVSAAAPGASSSTGCTGGCQTIAQANIPNYVIPSNFTVNRTGSVTLTGTGGTTALTAAAGPAGVGGGGSGNTTSLSVSDTQAFGILGQATSGGSGTSISIVSPSVTINYAIKVLSGTLPTVGVLSFGGMVGDILCGSGITCVNNIVSISGLGTMSSQNSNAVAITGGSITGMPTPTNPTDVAIKSYVDAASVGRTPLSPVRLATASILSNTPTYANGTAGVGRTLTAGSNGVLSIDSTAVALSDRVLIKDQAAQLQNGCYTLTTAGTVSIPYVLTGCTDADTAAEMPNGLTVLVTAGATNANGSWTLNQPNPITVGTTALPWVNTSAAIPSSNPQSVITFGASGSAQNTTGTVSASSTALTLASAIDFTNGQGIFIAHAGAAFTASPPSSLTVTPSVTNATTYAYRIASIDNACGVGAAITAITIANGPTTLTANAATAVTNNLSWSAGAGAWGYAVWRSTSGGAYQLIAVTNNTSMHDPGLPTAASVCVPATPPASSLADYLVTTVASGGGTTSIVLTAAATTAVTAGYVQHSDTAFINSAMAAQSTVYFPAGTYNIEGGVTVPSTVGAVRCDGSSNTIIQSPNANSNGNVFEATTGTAFNLSGCNVKSTIPNTVALVRAVDLGRSNSMISNVAVTGSTAFQIESGTVGVQVSNMRVEGWYNIGIRTLGANIAINSPLILAPTAFTGDGSGQAIAIQGGSHVVVSAGTILGSSQFGVTCTNVNYVTISSMDIFTYHEAIHPQDACNYFTITGNTVNSPYDIAISVADDAGLSAIGPGLINSNTVTQSYASGIGLVSSTHSVTEITIDGNAINNPNRNGGGTPSLACGVALIGQHTINNVVQNNVVVDDSAFTSWANCEFGSPAPNNNGFGLATKSTGMLLGTVNVLGAASFFFVRPTKTTGPANY